MRLEQQLGLLPLVVRAPRAASPRASGRSRHRVREQASARSSRRRPWGRPGHRREVLRPRSLAGRGAGASLRCCRSAATAAPDLPRKRASAAAPADGQRLAAARALSCARPEKPECLMTRARPDHRRRNRSSPPLPMPAPGASMACRGAGRASTWSPRPRRAGIDFVLARHETSAVIMAATEAELAGTPGRRAVHARPGRGQCGERHGACGARPRAGACCWRMASRRPSAPSPRTSTSTTRRCSRR